jgi:hypothetical protein
MLHVSRIQHHGRQGADGRRLAAEYPWAQGYGQHPAGYGKLRLGRVKTALGARDDGDCFAVLVLFQRFFQAVSVLLLIEKERQLCPGCPPDGRFKGGEKSSRPNFSRPGTALRPPRRFSAIAFFRISAMPSGFETHRCDGKGRSPTRRSPHISE